MPLLYLLEVYWTRATPHPDKPLKGCTEIAVRAASLVTAKDKARQKFTEQHGNNLRITGVLVKSEI
jgi:hypothetical protein